MKKFRLLKDLPGCCKGHIFGQNGTSSVFTMQTLAEMEDITSKCYTFNEDFVKLNTDWFRELSTGQFEVPTKAPLFKTEDGVAVFEYDIIHWCINSRGAWNYHYSLPTHKHHSRLVESRDIYRVFSSESLAREFTIKPSENEHINKLLDLPVAVDNTRYFITCDVFDESGRGFFTFCVAHYEDNSIWFDYSKTIKLESEFDREKSEEVRKYIFFIEKYFNIK